MKKVTRIFPGANNGLINWIEKNCHDINGFVATFNLKDGTTMTIYDTYSQVQAFGLLGVAEQVIHELIYEDEFILKTVGGENNEY